MKSFGNTMNRFYRLNLNSFCHICDKYVLKRDRRTINIHDKKIFAAYFFPSQIGDQDKKWAPKAICVRCNAQLSKWYTHGNAMPFEIPMMWREPKDHHSDCYVCVTQISCFN